VVAPPERGERVGGQLLGARLAGAALAGPFGVVALQHGGVGGDDAGDGLPDGAQSVLGDQLTQVPAEPSQVELVLGAAAEVLARADEPIDLIVADPPWALGRADHRSAYRRINRRDHSKVVPGYVEVPAAEYAAFTAKWVPVAAQALRLGGCLAVVTGPQQAGYAPKTRPGSPTSTASSSSARSARTAPGG
jgi:hypothetical protein